ncbi:hypothetical protein Taro_050874 [Colocasia esculenta]|uniref:Transmembrane protein n=1 Tax=Colocasia esculenta TaxID=4460 RepID=A0A843XF97_COLES|nr:hypothetical protein [Colocasia esculenta]
MRALEKPRQSIYLSVCLLSKTRRMEVISKYLLDITLVPVSLCVTAGYHAYVYRSFKAQRRRLTTVGVNQMRKKWLETVVERKDFLFNK